MTSKPSIADILVPFGFSHLEADIYTALLAESPLTAYAVSKRIGKPVANCYKAVESLQAKGAVMVDDRDTQQVRAVPYKELLDRLEQQFQQQLDAAATALEQVSQVSQDDGIYTLVHTDQVIERARSMLKRASGVVFIEAFPEPLRLLVDEIEAAAKRGVHIAVKEYSPVEIHGAEVVMHANAEGVLNNMENQYLAMAADAQEHLVALFSRDGKNVHQAIWSASPLLSWETSNYLEANILVHRILCELGNGKTNKELKQEIDAWTEYFPMDQSTGYNRLAERYGWDASAYHFPSITHLDRPKNP